MIMQELAKFLLDEAGKTDLSRRSPIDIAQRFERLEGFGLFPRGRGKNSQQLSVRQVIAGILSIASESFGQAGTASKILMDLVPVGGKGFSFRQSQTLGKALELILAEREARSSLLEMRVSCSEIYNNGYCRASIEYEENGKLAVAYFVRREATSLTHSDGLKNFDPRELMNTVVVDTVFYQRFFDRLARELMREIPQWTLAYRAEEDEDEEAKKEARARYLGLSSDSCFLNMPVDNQVTWPSTETAIDFEGHKLILLPKTRDNATSIHIDLRGQRINEAEAITLINRFLSLLTWCDDQFAVLQTGWSGNPVPVPTPKRNLAFTTAHQWLFNRKLPTSPEARKAIAMYREGRNAEQNFMVCYAVLSYFKIIELKHRGRGEVKNWFRDNYEKLRINPRFKDDVGDFERARGSERAHEYLYKACRVAVAHASEPYSTDPDDFNELRRLHVAADILRELARFFIREELGVSESFYDGT